MLVLEVALFISFAVLIVVGYKKKNRNVMLVASLCLLLAIAIPSFSDGFKEGFDKERTSLSR